MSRQIAEDKPLSERDRQYLEDRGQYHVVERIERGLNGEDGDGPTEPEGSDLSEAEARAGKAYEQWTVAELGAEVDRRNVEIEDEAEKLTKPTRKSDLIDVLRTDDEDLAADGE